jgi:hypothetical protein
MILKVENNWRKYLLSYDGIIDGHGNLGEYYREPKGYDDIVYFAHCAVADWLDAHPEDVHDYLTRPVLGYFYILKKASPEVCKKIDDWFMQKQQLELERVEDIKRICTERNIPYAPEGIRIT